MKQTWLLVLLCALSAALALAVGLAGETLMNTLALDATTLLLAAALLMFVLLAVSVRLVSPPRPTTGSDILIAFPVHWASFFSLGIMIGTLAAFGGVRLFGQGLVQGTVHMYEVAGLAVGILIVLLIAFRRAPIPAAAFALAFGLALPSAILFLDSANTIAMTYEGHLGVMGALAALVIIFGYVRIKIVD
jgi:hypothetical protein